MCSLNYAWTVKIVLHYIILFSIVCTVRAAVSSAELCALLLLCLCPWCWLGGRISSLDSSLMLLFKEELNTSWKCVFADPQWLNVSPCCSEVQVDSRTRWHHCWVWLQVQQSTLSDIIQPHLSVMLRSEVKRASDRLNFILRFSGLFICPLFGLSLHHFLPSAFLFLLHLFVLMISVYGAQLIYRKVKPTLHSQHASWCECILVNEQTALSHGAPICFHISSSEWSHIFFSQCSPKFSNISWRLSHWHPKVCWRTQTLRAGNEL